MILLMIMIAATTMLAMSKGLTVLFPSYSVLAALGLYAYGCMYNKRSEFISKASMRVGLLVAVSTAFALLVDAIAWGRPLCDSYFVCVDSKLGIHARSVADWLMQHRWSERVMYAAYFSFIPQIILAVLCDGLFLKRFTWCALVTCILFAVLPMPMGTYAELEPLSCNVAIKEHMLELSSGFNRVLDVEKCEGIVCSPSFHTIVAWLLIASAWNTRFRWFSVALNLLMIVSTIAVGAHYGIDLLLGTGVAILSFIFIWRD